MFRQIQAVRTGVNYQFIGATEADQSLRPGELLKLQGMAIPLDKVSGNGRRYIPESVHMQVAELQPRIAKKALFGCLDHPPTDDLNQLVYVKMTDVSHRIDAMWYDDKKKAYYVTVTILDTPNGRILKAIHDAGSPLYVSLRSLLDPAKNVQRNGYIDAWMLALITIDFVSRPGFADAELEAIDVSNEAALAVCESLNLFNSQRIFDMKQNNKRKYVPVVALESVTGVHVEPSKELNDRIKLFLADMLSKFPGKFSVQEFAKAYPTGMFGDNIIGLYEDTAELMLQSEDGKVTAMIELENPIDGKFMLTDDAAITCYQNGSVDYSNDIEEEEPATEMYAVVATEDYEPSEDFIATANKVAEYLRKNYENGFTQEEFNTELAQKLEDEFGVATRIDTEDDQENELKMVDKDGNHGASILLTLKDDKMIPTQISEYWMPGTEALEPGTKVKLIDKEGEVIAEGELQAVGTYGDMKETIEEEDATGAGLMAEAGIAEDAEVYKIDGNWYYIETGMTIESSESDCEEPEVGDDDKHMQVIANESEVEVIEETKELPINEEYMEKSDLEDAEDINVEVVEDDDDALRQQQALSDKMYQIIEEAEVETKNDDDKPEDTHKDDGKPEDNTAKTTDKENDADMSEIAEEAQRIFGMPNSKFAGNYAIEHMPTPYKHIWAGLSDAAKSVVAKQAIQANIATESQNLAFWSKTNFVAVERACLLGKGQVEAALEHIEVPDPLKSFLGKPLPSAHK